MMEPKTAMETAATIIVRMLLPSHTISTGARADFGRLLSMTRHGSRIFASVSHFHRRTAAAALKTVTSRKLIRVSQMVMPVCRKMLRALLR